MTGPIFKILIIYLKYILEFIYERISGRVGQDHTKDRVDFEIYSKNPFCMVSTWNSFIM